MKNKKRNWKRTKMKIKWKCKLYGDIVITNSNEHYKIKFISN